MKASDAINHISTFKLGQQKFNNWAARNGRPQLALQLQDCGSWLKFREWINSGESRLRQANFCHKFLVCRCCAAIRAGKMLQKYAERVEQIRSQNPGLIPIMVTLTVANGPDLLERMTHLESAFRKMLTAARLGKSSKLRNRPVEWNKVQGHIAAYEITNEGKGWHPHIHVFALVDRFIDHKAICDEWWKYTHDSYIVSLNRCPSKDIVKGLIEVLKYSSKLNDMKPEHVLEVADTLKGKRWINAGGILRGVKVPDIDSDDAEGLDGPYVDYVARWILSQARYDIRPDTGNALVIERPNRHGNKV